MKNIEEKLIDNHEMLYKIAAKYLRDHNDILDALQETAYKALKNQHKVKDENYTLTWIIRILINNCLHILKKKKTFEIVEFKANFIYENCDTIDHSLEISEGLLKINKKYRDVIVLKYIEGYKIKEIAKIYNRPENTIKTWLKRGLESLKSEVVEYE